MIFTRKVKAKAEAEDDAEVNEKALSAKNIDWDLDVSLHYLIADGRGGSIHDLYGIQEMIAKYKLNTEMGMEGVWVPNEERKRFETSVLKELVRRELASIDADGSCTVTIKGRRFYSNPPWWWRKKHRPFAYENFKNNVDTTFKVAKVVATVFYSLAVLGVAIWAAIHHS